MEQQSHLRASQIRHSRTLLSGIQGRNLDPRLKRSGVTKINPKSIVRTAWLKLPNAHTPCAGSARFALRIVPRLRL